MKQYFCLYDRKAEGKLEPFLSHNSQTAMRDTQIQMRKSEHLHEYAADFDLILLGTWDDQAGIEGIPEQVIINCGALVETNNDAQ